MTVELNNKKINKNINYKLLADEEMEKLGFSKIDGDKPHFYYCSILVKNEFSSITFNMRLPIPVDNDNLDIFILDEAFGQHYDYQYILSNNPNFEFAKKISNLVEEKMSYFKNRGILSGHERGDYI